MSDTIHDRPRRPRVYGNDTWLGVSKWIWWLLAILVVTLTGLLTFRVISPHTWVILEMATILAAVALLLGMWLPRWMVRLLLLVVILIAGYQLFKTPIDRRLHETHVFAEKVLKPSPKLAQAPRPSAPTASTSATPNATGAPASLPAAAPQGMQFVSNTSAAPAARVNEPTGLPPVPKLRPARVVLGPCAPGDMGKLYQWQHSGGNPYARSQAEAFSDAKLDRMLACNSIPRADWNGIKQQLRTTSGESFMLRVGDTLSTMMFGNGQMVKNVVVRIPGGQLALRYRVEVNGHSYVFVLPLGCWNFSLESQRQPPKQPDCVRLSFMAYPGGTVTTGVATTTGPMPPSVCNKQRQGNGAWEEWHGACPNCRVPTASFEFADGILHGTVVMHHARAWKATESLQTISFDRAVLGKMPWICLTDTNGRQTYIVFMPPEDWKGRTEVTIANSFFRFPAQ